MAEDFKAQHKYDLAISVYRRVVFFDSAQQYANKSYQGLAESYYETRRFDLAAYYFDLAFYSSDSSSNSNYFIIQKASSLIQIDDFSSALTELLSIEHDNNPNEEFLRNFYTTYAYFGMGNYSMSEDVSFKYFRSHSADSNSILELTNQYKQLGKSVKNAERARIYSQIVPGLGQLYAGDKKAALNSFVLVGALGFGGLYTTFNVGVLDAAFMFGPWFYRYYAGGYGKAEKIVLKKNQQNSSLIFKGILDDWVYFYDSKVKEQL